MTDKNDALFLVRLPFGQKTIPYEEVPELIAMARSPGYDGEKASEHEAVMLALGVCQEEGPLRAAVQAGEVEVLDKSLHRMTQPFNGRLKDTVLTVQALREYVESIKGFLEVEDAPEPQATTPSPAPVVQAQAKRRSWWDAASPYIVKIMQDGQYATAKELYNALDAKAGPNSPFDQGTGNYHYSLFIREIAAPLKIKTVQNNWQKLLNAAAKK